MKMRDFDDLLVENWHDHGLVLSVPQRSVRHATKALLKMAEKFSIGISAMGVGVAMSMASLPAYSAASLIWNETNQSAAFSNGLNGELPKYYWRDLVSSIKQLPRLPEVQDDLSIEPYV